MQNRDSAPTASRRAVVVCPNSKMLADLEPLLATHLAQVPVTRLSTYPSPRDLRTTLTANTGGSTVVFLDVASDPDQAVQLLAEMAQANANIPVLAMLSGNDPDFILRCLRAGATDFLVRPFTAEQMEAGLTKLARAVPVAEGSGQEPSKFIVVMPAKGACGATTIACNLAFYWKRLGAKRILLCDLDPMTGTLSFLLKIKSVYSFLDVLQRAHELDEDLWQAMVTDVSGVDVLLAPELITETPTGLSDPSPILDYARHFYDVVIIDASSVYGEWNLNLARAASELLLVTTNELPALQAAQRALSYLDANRIGRWKVRLVVNRYQRDIGLSREVIGTALHVDVFDSLPSDYEAVQRSLMEGKPVPAGTALGKSLAQLAERLGGAGDPGKKSGSSKSGLFGLFSKSSK